MIKSSKEVGSGHRFLYLRENVGAVIDEGGSMLEAYEIDQSDFMHLPTAEFLSKRNAGQVFQMMEFE